MYGKSKVYLPWDLLTIPHWSTLVISAVYDFAGRTRIPDRWSWEHQGVHSSIWSGDINFWRYHLGLCYYINGEFYKSIYYFKGVRCNNRFFDKSKKYINIIENRHHIGF